MPRITSYRPSPAMVVAFIALLLALGGGAYAQIRIPNNSVGSKNSKTTQSPRRRSRTARSTRTRSRTAR